MTAQFDTLSAALAVLETQNATLISLGTQLAAAARTGASMTQAEVKILSDRIMAWTTTDAAAVTADTPLRSFPAP